MAEGDKVTLKGIMEKEAAEKKKITVNARKVFQALEDAGGLEPGASTTTTLGTPEQDSRGTKSLKPPKSQAEIEVENR